MIILWWLHYKKPPRIYSNNVSVGRKLEYILSTATALQLLIMERTLMGARDTVGLYTV